MTLDGPPTFIVADDHPLFRDALRQTVENAFPGASILEAGTLEEVAAAINQNDDIDIILFDLSMPGTRAFSGLIYFRAQFPATPVCVVSASEDAATIRNAMAIGASGFVPKSASTDDIRTAIETILAGGQWTPRDVDLSLDNDPNADLIARLRSLTPQQVRVLMMLSEGLLNKQIADRLGVQLRTVKAHMTRIMERLGVRNRAQAIRVLHEMGLADPSRQIEELPEP